MNQNYNSTFNDFLKDFALNKNDLILTNKYIFEPYFDKNVCCAQVIYQEDYAKGEQIDIMFDEIIKEASKNNYHRIITIGGGLILLKY